MMRLLCNGEVLDIYENTNVQFVHDNPLFAFDEISCERTTAFKLPATPTNDRLLALARIPAYTGEGMRRKFAAQLQMGVVVEDGYLYVSSWSGKEYEAIFVTGEMVGLQRLRDAGKIADYWGTAGAILWNAENVRNANTQDGQASVAITRYLTTQGVLCHPSVDLSDVMDIAYNRLTGAHISARTRGYRLIPREMPVLPTQTMQLNFEGTGAPASSSYSVTTPANNIRVNQELSPLFETVSQVLLFYAAGMSDRYWSIRQLQARQTLAITFPADFSDDYFLMSIRDTGQAAADPEYSPFSRSWFLGGYEFQPDIRNNTLNIYGRPLAGQTITIERGIRFVLVNKNWISWIPNNYISGFTNWSDTSHIYTFGVTVEGSEVSAGDYVRVLDLLPDKTLIDLFKIYAALEGKLLNYSEADGVTFDDLNISTWQTLDITDKLIEVGKVSRTFGDYAQRNVVKFDSGEDVPKEMQIEEAYTVDNDNLETSKDLAVIPYSEGVRDSRGGFAVPLFKQSDGYDIYADSIGVAKGNTTTVPDMPYMQRVELKKNAGLQALCDASTQVEVQARMNVYEYTRVTAKTKILMQGTEYVWTSRSWQNSVAKFVLAKISA